MPLIGTLGYAPRHFSSADIAGRVVPTHGMFGTTGFVSRHVTALAGRTSNPTPPTYTSPPPLTDVTKAVPTWSVQLAVLSVLAHVFTIGQSAIGGTDVIGGGLAPVFEDITSDVMSFTTRRGRTSNLDQMQQGTCQLNVTDSTGKYNPEGGYQNTTVAYQPCCALHMDDVYNPNKPMAQDLSGHAHHGTYYGNVSLQQIGSNSAMNTHGTSNSAFFDGSSAYVDVPTATALHPGDTFSLECWYKRVATGAQALISTYSNNDYQLLFDASNKIALYKFGSGAVWVSSSAYTDTTSWHHLVVTKSGASVSVYRDGSSIAGTLTNQTIVASTSDIYIGYDASHYYQGYLDDVAIYSTALPLSSVAAHYNFGNGSVSEVMLDSPVGFWRLNDSVMSGYSTLDSSGFGEQGTYYGDIHNNINSPVSIGAAFDGWSANIQISSFSVSGTVAVEGWFNTSSNATQYIIEKSPINTNWALFISNGALTWTGGSSVSVATSGSYADGNWHHFYVQQVGTNVVIYVDGVQVKTGSADAIGNAVGTIYIGGAVEAVTCFFVGGLDEITIYTHTLTAAQVAAHYARRTDFGSQIQPMLPVKISATFYDYATTITNDAPALWYRFSDALASTTITDSSGAGINGTPVSALLQQQSIIIDCSPAIRFNGVASYVSTTTPLSLQFTNAFSFEMWARLDVLQEGGLAGQKWNAGNFWGLYVRADGYGGYYLSFRVTASGMSYSVRTGSIRTAMWYHIVGTFSGSQIILWVNNTEYGPVSLSPSISFASGSATVYVGGDGFFGLYTAATVDEFALYNYVLPSYRITAHYEAGIGSGGDTKTFPQWYGFISRVEHNPDPASQTTMIESVDYFEQLNIVYPTIQTQYVQRTDQIISTILANMPLTDPNFINLETAPDVIQAWGDAITTTDQNGNPVGSQNTALTLFQDLTDFDLGLIFIGKDGATTYITRANRFSIPIPEAIWDGTILGPGTKPATDKQLIYNYCAAQREYTQIEVNTSGSPSGGTFTLVLDNQTTGSLNYNATHGDVESALGALSQVGATNVSCSGGPLGSNSVICKLVGQRPDPTVGTNSLTGGTNPTITLSSSLTGSTIETAENTTSEKNFGQRAYAQESSPTQSPYWTSDSQSNSFSNFIVDVNASSRPPLRTGTILNGPATSASPNNEAARRLYQILSHEINDPVAVDLTAGPYGGNTYVVGTIQQINTNVQQAGTVVQGQYTVQPSSLPSGGGIFTIGVSTIGSADVLGY